MFPAPYLEVSVLGLGIVILLLEAFVARIDRKVFAIVAIIGLAAVLVATFFVADRSAAATAGFWNFYTADSLALFFKRFALVTTILVLVMMIDYGPAMVKTDQAPPNLGEFFALPVFTCAGLMYLASAIDFIFIFVSIELVTISFFVLVC